MGDELSETLSRQKIEKEVVISSIWGNFLEKKMLEAEFEKIKLDI